MAGLPTILENCPIKESTFEIRFESSFPAGAIYGIAYKDLEDYYTDSEPLPILQIPETVRTADPNFRHQPYYRMKGKDFTLQIGPKIIAITVKDPYCGWESYKNEIIRVFQILAKLDFISEVTRIGLRYVNTFKSGILDEIKFEIKINDVVVRNNETLLRTVFEEEHDFKTILHIANEAVITEADGDPYTGSMIDVDVSKAGENLPFMENIDGLIEEAHDIEKRRFFELLKDDFLDTFKPVYEEVK